MSRNRWIQNLSRSARSVRKRSPFARWFYNVAPSSFRNPPSGRRNVNRDVITDVKMYTVGTLDARKETLKCVRALPRSLAHSAHKSLLLFPPSLSHPTIRIIRAAERHLRRALSA